MNKEIEQLLKKNSCLSENEHGKIHCSVTNHDIPLNIEAIKAHLCSKKFIKMSKSVNFDFDSYDPYIVPHKRDGRYMYCVLTKRELIKVDK